MEVNGQSLEATAAPSITAGVNERVHQTNASRAQDYSSGMSEARGLLGAPSGNSAMAYGDSATSAAIRSRYSQDYFRKENELRTEIMRNAEQDHLRSLQTASTAAGQEVEQNKQKALLKWKIEQANKRARGAVVGQILGITGAVIGGVAGGVSTVGVGAAPGAAAGYAAGTGIGNAIGSS